VFQICGNKKSLPEFAALEGFIYLVLELSQGSFIFSGIIMIIAMFIVALISKPLQYLEYCMFLPE
jgi:hypothetical protein